MHLTVIHRKSNCLSSDQIPLLNFAFDNKSIFKMILDEFQNKAGFRRTGPFALAVPDDWQSTVAGSQKEVIHYNSNIPLTGLNPDQWLVISNGKYVTQFDPELLAKIMNNYNDGLITINVDPDLLSFREKVQTTASGHVTGIRRIYCDSILPVADPDDWPMHLLVKFADIERIFSDQLPENFDIFKNRCQLNSLKLNSFKIAGKIFDLEKEDHLIKFISQKMKAKSPLTHFSNISCGQNCDIAKNARFIGPVKLGSNIRVEKDAVLVGPVVISDNVTVGNCAVVKSSALAPGLSIPPCCSIENRVLSSKINLKQNNQTRLIYVKDNSQDNFRKWSRFSYVNTLKRFADLFVSAMVLIFFAPLFPVIALVIKLTSKGPVFFKHKRQGLHGRDFNCLKFRTMITGADEIQAKLRSHNQVDGPQFMVEDDPRVTVVGKFLRNTFIDEIPQFINVLLGQMSLVGPRPSPKSENSLCPPWRDARLSVRPGITGLWQVSRTRQPGKDFQEWIYYDTCYVRNLSLKMDLKICFKTAKKIAIDFVKQF